ncbi:MAG TPA: NADH-quinone oxidoreductase subunit J [Gemmatimonadales bacterium]|jgi:NADH-quinone oxidoreductase subunit J|nr:NADH-quinone oxidoreductase subunit J [Gemmatimonadales bacterium]
MTETVFYIFAAAAVISAAMCVLQRSPVGALIWLVQAMLALGAIFVLLDAQFIGVIQILVYAGAIMVLFLFIIMLLNMGRTTSDIRGPAGITATIVLAGLIALELGGLWAYSTPRIGREVRASAGFIAAGKAFAGGQAVQDATAAHGVVGGIAPPLFNEYLVPFEVTSILLLAAIVGAVVLAKRKV